MKASPTPALKLTKREIRILRGGDGPPVPIKKLLRWAKLAAATASGLKGKKNAHKARVKKVLVDSGASATVVDQISLLLKIHNRVKLSVKTALGHSTESTGHGALRFFVRNAEGAESEFTNIGEGFKLDNLIYSLLSVSQLCDNGCTVVFKPSGAHIMTGTGEVIPREKESGLYFLPVSEEPSPLKSTSTTYSVTDPDEVAKTERAKTMEKHGPAIRAATTMAMKSL